MTAWLEGLGLQRARDLVDVPANEALGMTRRGCLPLRHGDVLLGFLWVIVGDRPLSDDERAALARGAGEAAENLWARDERRERTRSLLRAALAGKGAAELAAALRWPAIGSYAVAVFAGGEEVAERLRRRRGAADFAWTSEPERLVILARDPDGLPAALAAAGATGGVSASFDALDHAPVALRAGRGRGAVRPGEPGVRTGRAVRQSRQLGRWSPSCGGMPAVRSHRSRSSSWPRTAAASS